MKNKIMDNIRKILSLTGLTLVVLGLGAALYGGTWIYIPTIFQCLLINIIIQIGLYCFRNFESKYVIVEYLVEMTFLLIVVLICGYIFSWYEGTPIWFLILVGIFVYIIGSFFGIMQVKNDIEYISEELKRINKK